MPGALALGIDIGGTFTDLFAISKDGRFWSTKLLSTPRDPSVGFLQILDRMLENEQSFIPQFAG